MKPAKYNIQLQQGADWDKLLTVKDTQETPAIIDLTGYTAKLQIRKEKGSRVVLYEATEVSGLTITGASGTIRILIPSATTANFNFQSAVYDMIIDSGSKVTRIMEGNVFLNRRVTE